MRKVHVKNNSKGQALLFVVVATTVALAIGINASVRTITSLSRTTRTDTASRALAAAEGGIERFLPLSIVDLEDAASNNCPIGNYDERSNSCEVILETSVEDSITSKANVTVERYEPENYPFELESGQVKEVNMYDYNSGVFYGDDEIELCWSSTPLSDPDRASELMYIAYNESGVQARGGLTGSNRPDSPYESGGFTSAGAGHDGFDNCQNVTIGSDIYGLRIRSVGGSSSVGVFPTSGEDLPLQGYTIKSIGSLVQNDSVTATRSITIIRTLPYLPVAFDYALYVEGSVSK